MQIHHIYKELEGEKGLLYAWFEAMHTRADLILYGRQENDLKEIAEAIHNKVSDIEKVANYYNPSSELYRVNTEASHNPVQVSDQLFEMINECIVFHTRTFGLFDITIKSEDYNKDTINAVKLSTADSTVFFTHPGVKIDLSGYVKGYALEQIRDILQTFGLENTLVSMGNSSVLALGNHPHGKGWKIGFNDPLQKNNGKDLYLYNECLTTSGNETEQRRHIIHPVTGTYLEGKQRLSVITNKGTEGEIFSTALLLADPNTRKKLSEEYNLKYHEYKT